MQMLIKGGVINYDAKLGLASGTFLPKHVALALTKTQNAVLMTSSSFFES